MKSFVRELVNFVYPPACPLCRTPLGPHEIVGLCPACREGIQYIEKPLCPHCGRPYAHEEISPHLCGECIAGTRYFRMARAVGYYRGSLKDALQLFKFRLGQRLASTLGTMMTERLYALSDDWSYQLVMPVPLHPRRLRSRGFNQALCLAASVGRHLQIPLDRYTMRRRRWTRSQVGLTGRQRADNVHNAFVLTTSKPVAGRSILLVDDIYTSGSTVNECSRVLISAGARHVDVLTLARVA